MFDFTVDQPKKGPANRASVSPTKLKPVHLSHEKTSSSEEESTMERKGSRRVASPTIGISPHGGPKPSGNHVSSKAATNFLFGSPPFKSHKKSSVYAEESHKESPFPPQPHIVQKKPPVLPPSSTTGSSHPLTSVYAEESHKESPFPPQPHIVQKKPPVLPPSSTTGSSHPLKSSVTLEGSPEHRASVMKNKLHRLSSESSSSLEDEHGMRRTELASYSPKKGQMEMESIHPMVHEIQTKAKLSSPHEQLTIVTSPYGDDLQDLSPSVIQNQPHDQTLMPFTELRQYMEQESLVRGEKSRISYNHPLLVEPSQGVSSLVEMVERNLGLDQIGRTHADAADPYERYLHKVSRLISDELNQNNEYKDNTNITSEHHRFKSSMDFTNILPIEQLKGTNKRDCTTDRLTDLFSGQDADFKNIVQIRREREISLIPNEFIIEPKTRDKIQRISGDLKWTDFFDYVNRQPRRI